MLYRRTHPTLDSRGVRPGVNSPVVIGGVDGRAVSARSDIRSELVDRLPGLITISCGFARLGIPEDGALPFQMGHKLLTVDPDDFGQELWLNSLTIDQLPADVDGSAPFVTVPGNVAAAWGDRWGRRACIAIGVDIQKGAYVGESADSEAWYRMNVGDAGFGRDEGGWTVPANLSNESVSSGVLWRCGFPSGKLTDAVVMRRVITKGFGGLGAKIGSGQKLDVWFVVEANTGTPAINGQYLHGHVDIQLHFAPTRSTQRFSETLA